MSRGTFIYTHYALIFVIVLVNLALAGKIDKKKRILDAIVFVVLVGFYSLFFATHAFELGTDSKNYLQWYESIGVAEGELFKSDFLSLKNAALTLIFWIFKIFGFSFVQVRFSLAIFINIWQAFLLYSFSKKYPAVTNTLVLALVLMTFSVINLELTLLRNHMALLAALTSIAAYRASRLVSLLSVVLALILHLSLAVPLLFYALILKTKLKLSRYLVIYLIASLLSLAGLGFDALGDEILKQLGMYWDVKQVAYKVGFRQDFFAYNTVFLVLFILWRRRYNQELIKLYILTSSWFVLCFNIPFSDRWGLYSWILIPLIFITDSRVKLKGLQNTLRLQIVAFTLLILNFFLFA